MRWLLFLCVLIWIWSLTAWGKEEKKIFQFGCAYFDGITIGLLCMEVLPMAFGESFFWLGVLGIVCGVCGSCVLEHTKRNWMGQQWLHSLVASLLVWFWLFGTEIKGGSAVVPFFLAFFGGVFLFFACDGVLPEGKGRKEGFFRGLGGMCGFLTTMLFF